MSLETTQTLVEVPSDPGSLEIRLPATVVDWSALGITLGSAFALVEILARNWLRYSPLARQLFPRLFAGSWDEQLDAIARFIQKSDIRFVETSPEEIKAALKDPSTTAQLLTTGARVTVVHTGNKPHVTIEPEEQAPQQQGWGWLWRHRCKVR